MKKIIEQFPFLVIMVSFLLGWGVHSLMLGDTRLTETSLTVPTSQLECSSCDEVTSPEVVEKIVTKEVIKFVPNVKIVYKTKEKKEDTNSSIKDLFVMALEKDEFYDAMTYYEEAEEEKHSIYQIILLGYFNKIQRKELAKAVEQMQYFIEIEPQSKIIIFQLAQLFENRGEYKEALNLIIEFSYTASYNEKSVINTAIKGISVSYINKLKSANNFESLIEFLKNRIDIGFLSDFYSFELAKVYLKLKKYMDSVEVLDELQNSDVYKERAIEMLTFIQNKLEEQEEYPVQVPLIRDGLHFLVKAYVDNVPLLLLIDTGASTTSVDYNKISHLKIFRENVKFHTAGGEIYETIFQADRFTIDSVSLQNFKISSLQFSGGREDGLLGMNFLGKFKFKIDQKEAILFLGNKN